MKTKFAIIASGIILAAALAAIVKAQEKPEEEVTVQIKVIEFEGSQYLMVRSGNLASICPRTPPKPELPEPKIRQKPLKWNEF